VLVTVAHLVSDDVLPPLRGSRLFTAWELDGTVLALVCVVAALYVAGVLRLRARGVRWPVGRSVAFLVGGLGTLVVATMSPLGTYDDTLFTTHMLQHMLLAMVAPVFLALGAPITLALRATRTAVRRQIVALLHSRVARVLTWPPLAWLHFVALPFVLYDTAWYDATLRHPVLHEWLHVQFVVAGCIFFWPLLGLDPMPRRLGYPARMLMTFLTLPFHAFLGLSIMMQTRVIAHDYYAALGRTWGPSLRADQQTGGGVLWASGDLVGLLFFGVMFFQWQRADSRAALRGDRRLRREQASSAWRPAAAAGNEGGGAPAASAAGPVLTRPWWEVDPGPLAERMRREGWRPGDAPTPEHTGD
jgi:putative copper resistance protein D